MALTEGDVIHGDSFIDTRAKFASWIAIESGISVINKKIKSGNSFTKKLDKSGK